MDEYIKRKDALEITKRTSGDYSTAFAEICKIPAADISPVVYGEWIWHEEEFEYECSVCHCRFDYNHTFEIFDHGFQYANYCPNCGAKMNESKCEGVQHNG